MRGQTETLTVSLELRAVSEGFASLAEAGNYLRLSRATLYKLMEGGQLAFARFGRSRRVPWTALKEYASRSLVCPRTVT